jgi:hypothetical protein
MRVLLFLLLITTYAKAQVSLLLSEPKTISTSVSELFNVSIIANQATKVVVRGIIISKNGTKVVDATSSTIQLNPGVNVFNEQTINPNYIINKANTANRVLTYGEYNFCIYAMNPDTKEELAEDCKDVTVTLLNPPMLINPPDEELLLTRLPLFNWIPPTPILSANDIKYEMKLCEVRKGQTTADAFSKNRAIFLIKDLTIPSYQYTSANYPLDTGISYSWGVSVKNRYDEVIGITEVWSFKIVDGFNTTTDAKITKGYIRLRDEVDGQALLVKDQIKIIYDERYTESEGVLEIMDNKGKIYSDNVKVLQGENRYEVDLELLSGLKEGQDYQLVFSPSGRSKKYLLFNIVK